MRRRVKKVNPCKVSVKRLARMSEKALFKGAAGISSRDPASRTVKAIMENLGALKVSRRVHDGAMRRNSTRSYGIIVRELTAKLHKQQKKQCKR